MKRKHKVYYIYPAFSTFVAKDIAILEERYQVITPGFSWDSKWLLPVNLIRQFFFLLVNQFRVTCGFVMFGGYWSFLPALMGKLTGKPVYIILGGTDCVSFPTIQYGSLRKPILRQIIKWSYQLAAKLLPVDESLVQCSYSYFEPERYKGQGYKFFFPEISTPYQVIYNGFDPSVFNPGHTEKIPGTFITVAGIRNEMRFRLKGIDLIVYLADQFPEVKFTVVGLSDEFRQHLTGMPDNLKTYPALKPDDFKHLLYQSEFYIQPSISEGFPNALCEGMLARCIPIGSAVGAIPVIIGNTGQLLASADPAECTRQIKKLLSLSREQKEKLADAARERIISNFGLDKRKNAFLDLGS